MLDAAALRSDLTSTLTYQQIGDGEKRFCWSVEKVHVCKGCAIPCLRCTQPGSDKLNAQHQQHRGAIKAGELHCGC